VKKDMQPLYQIQSALDNPENLTQAKTTIERVSASTQNAMSANRMWKNGLQRTAMQVSNLFRN
jgi:hypothetical protein